MARLRTLSALIAVLLALFAVSTSAAALDSRAPRCKEQCITRCNRKPAAQIPPCLMKCQNRPPCVATSLGTSVVAGVTTAAGLPAQTSGIGAPQVTTPPVGAVGTTSAAPAATGISPQAGVISCQDVPAPAPPTSILPAPVSSRSPAASAPAQQPPASTTNVVITRPAVTTAPTLPTSAAAPPTPATTRASSIARPPVTTSAATTPPAAGQAGTTPGTTLRSAAISKGKYFGAAVSPNLFATAAYANALKTEYGWLTPGNAMKWDATEPAQGQFRFTDADAVVKQAQANGQMIRGHTLVWHSQLPAWVPNTAGTDIAKARAIMMNHINTVVGRYKGQLAHWDVCNEVLNEDGTFRQSFWFNAWGGIGYVAEAFRLARAADPTVKLYINDFNVESPNGAKTNGYFNLVSSLKAQGVPIDGVGFQAHFITGQIPDIAATLRRFAALGVDVAITELDIRLQLPASAATRATQAANYATVVNACKSVAGCVGVTAWGVADTDSWVPQFFPGFGEALLLDANYQKKAAYTSTLNALNA